MTNKLKKKIKKIALIGTSSILSFATLGVVGTRLLVMQENKNIAFPISKETVEIGETEIITGVSESANIEESRQIANVAEDGAIICESLIQGVRDNDLNDGTYTFRVARKSRNNSRNKRLYSRVNKF
ncbi:MAG: hypothetical protein HFJ50_06765 [Clostridia bacterium]|jgi:hypothetical protein|nr:hypothetical protein [Clostridia bacterium]